VEAGDIGTALGIVDQLSQVFKIDALKMKAEAALALDKSVHNPDIYTKAIPLVNALVDAALADDRYDLARPGAEMVLTIGRASSNAVLSRRASTLMQRVKDAENAYTGVKESLLVLAARPDDPSANLKVGCFRCFIKADWAGGLPMLAQGNDTALGALAKDDVAGPVSPEDQMKLGDGWWDVAEKQIGWSRRICYTHAAEWYRKARPQLASSLAKQKVPTRLKAVESLAETGMVTLQDK